MTDQKSLKGSLENLWKRSDLIWALASRELSQRYRGSYLGVVWSVIVPLVMLLIYTFVFSLVFKSRWPGMAQDTPPEQFALILFAGITPFNLFSEVVNRAPNLILNNPNYVKKVIFPLEILPVVSLIVASINSLISIGLLILGNLILMHTVSSTIYLLPLAYLPLLLLSLALGWFLASLGVYVRDIGQGIGVVVQILFFVSPVFYSISAAPQPLQPFLAANPMGTIINGFRQVLLWGQPLPWVGWALCSLVSGILAVLAYGWFMTTKKGFADVL
jgi:lipopolysaccharide transport system permease protein